MTLRTRTLGYRGGWMRGSSVPLPVHEAAFFLVASECRKSTCFPKRSQFKGAQSRYFELFWTHTKLPLNGKKPENNNLIR